MNLNALTGTARSEVVLPCRPAKPGEFLSFTLGSQDYGVDLLRVQEIRRYEAPTHIANAPASLRGVLDLRGEIVPVLDLRTLVGIESPRFGDTTVIVVLTLGDNTLGVIADTVSDVVRVDADELHPLPAMSGLADAKFFTGVATVAERMLVLIDVDALSTCCGGRVASTRPTH